MSRFYEFFKMHSCSESKENVPQDIITETKAT
jgi:hypothetical protein